MAAYAALVSLLSTIDQITKHPSLSTSLDKKQIQPLVQKAAFLLDFIEKNNYGGGSSSNKEAEDLERQIASAAHAAKNVIESHIVDQIHAESTAASRSHLTFSYLFFFLTPKKSIALQQIMEEMDGVIDKATVLKEKHRGSREATHSRAAAALMETGESSTRSRTRMVGLDDELNQLLNELTGYQSSRCVTSIVGMGGMGKSTLAQNVNENPLIKEHFVFRAWATVSEQHDAENILSQLLSGLGKPTTGDNVDSLGEQLHKALSGRRYLIVLDDVWSVGAWDKVRRFFPDNGNKSRVILTTRQSNVAKDCGSSVFRMNLLDGEKSWELFCVKTLLSKDDPVELIEVGKAIVRSCNGLALSIVVIGGILCKSPRTVGFWQDVAKDLYFKGKKEETLEVLSLSYSHLPPHLKPCFLYMGVFEEDSEMRVSKIVKLWVAEGLIKLERGRVLEDVAKGYLNDLIERNLVLVGKLSKNGKIGSCGIHDLLRDLCIKLSEQQQFFQAMQKYHDEPVTGRLVRVLDVDSTFECAEDLYGNVNLRYLAHPYDKRKYTWWTGKLHILVSLVWNLQTLIITKFKYHLVVAPVEIWKMRQLRHVQCCNNIYLPDPPPCNEQEVVMDNLQTLKKALNLRLSEVCKMIPNMRKLNLRYDCDLHGYDDSLIECLCNLDRLHKLESLKLRIRNSKWPAPDPDMVKKLRFPSSLNKLSLSDCKLHWNDLTIIGSLPQLQVLKLNMYSVGAGERWSPIEGQFQSLKFLKIGCFGPSVNLLYWETESSHFPVLEKFILKNLQYLEEIPLDIGNIPTLQLIRVDNCTESAAISVVKIKEEQLENQGDDCQLQIHVILKSYNSNLESFKERLETEGLALDSLQLEIC